MLTTVLTSIITAFGTVIITTLASLAGCTYPVT
jgi:hypothetical protein